MGLILDKTLEPHVVERLDAVRVALGKLNAKDSGNYRRRELRAADPAEALLSLRVCDPAMGSGHFLVSLVDMLADHVLDAMAEAASLGADLHYISPLADKIENIRDTILKNAKAANWTIDEEQAELEKALQRTIPGQVRWLRNGNDLPAFLEGLGVAKDSAIPVHALVDPKGMVRCVRVGSVSEEAFGSIKTILQGT